MEVQVLSRAKIMVQKTLALLLLSILGAAAPLAAVDADGEILYSGQLRPPGRRHSPLSGTWHIVMHEDGTRTLVLGEDFRANSGPDLKIFFSSLPLRRINGENAASAYSVRIGRLKQPRGAQHYSLPESLDLDTHRTWVVHCERYAHLWGGVELTPPPLPAEPELPADN